MCSKILVLGGDYLAKTIPMIITNNNILIKDKEDIVKSLKEAGIVNYIMPYDFDWLLDKECSD